MVVTVYNSSGCVIGLAPFYSLETPGDPLALRCLRLFGAIDGAESATEEPIMMLRAGHEQEALAALFRHFEQRTAFRSWDYLLMRWPTPAAPPPAYARAAWWPRFIETYQTDWNEVVSLPDSWAAFRQGLSKSMRDNLAYYPRLLTRGGHHWKIRVVESPNGMREAAETLVALHHCRADSSRGKKHSNHLPGETHRRLLTCALPRLAERNMASIFLLEVDGTAVAALCALENAGLVTIYYTGFNTAWYWCSPITILTAEAIRCAISKGNTAVNFLPTPMDWKTRWGAASQHKMLEVRRLSVRPLSLLRGCMAHRANRYGARRLPQL